MQPYLGFDRLKNTHLFNKYLLVLEENLRPNLPSLCQHEEWLHLPYLCHFYLMDPINIAPLF